MKKSAVLLLVLLMSVGVTRASAECVVQASDPKRAEVALKICDMYPYVVMVYVYGGTVRLTMPHSHHQTIMNVVEGTADAADAESAAVLMMWEVGRELYRAQGGPGSARFKFVNLVCERTFLGGSHADKEPVHVYMAAAHFLAENRMNYSMRDGKIKTYSPG
jgi:hypothetical protein